MNKDIYDIIGLIAIFWPFIGLLALIAYKVYRKFHPAKKQVPVEQRLKRIPDEPSWLRKLTGIPRAIAEFISLAFLVLCAGTLTGIIAALLSYVIYLLLVSPLVMGVASGGMTMGAIRMGKVRNTSQVIFLSLLAAVSVYGTFHYTRYMGLQLQTSLKMFPGLSEATEEKNLRAAHVLVDYALEKETGYPGFVGYMLFKAKDGMSVGRFYHSQRLNLGPVLTWLYWATEFGMILWITVSMGKRFAASLCKFCGNFYGSEKYLGGTTCTNQSRVLELIKQKDFTQLGKLIEKNADVPSLELYFRGCSVCNQNHSHLVVRQVSQGPKGLEFKDMSKFVLPPQESARLLNQLNFIGN